MKEISHITTLDSDWPHAHTHQGAQFREHQLSYTYDGQSTYEASKSLTVNKIDIEVFGIFLIRFLFNMGRLAISYAYFFRYPFESQSIL